MSKANAIDVQNGAALIDGNVDSFAFILLFLSACDGDLNDDEATYMSMEVSNLIDAYDLEHEEDISTQSVLIKASKNWEACGSQQDVIKVLFFCIKVLKDGLAKDIREGLLSKFRDIITHGGNKKKEVKEKYFSFIEEHLLK